MKKLLVIAVLSLFSAFFLVGCESLPEGNRGGFSTPEHSGGHHH
ncbi:MAG: hypothetical protein WC205_07910 [Opitutaceae bacterium]